MENFDKVLNILLEETGQKKGGSVTLAIQLTEAAKKICEREKEVDLSEYKVIVFNTLLLNKKDETLAIEEIAKGIKEKYKIIKK